MEEASKGLVLSSQTETLVREIEDANTVDDSDSGVCDGIPTEDGNTVYSVSDEKQLKAEGASVEDTVGSVTDEETKDNVDKVQRSVDGEMLSVAEKKAYQEMNNNKMDFDSKHGNEECETNSDSEKVTEESTQFSQGNSGTVSEVSSAAEICHGEEISNANTAEEHVKKDVEVCGRLDNAADKPAGVIVVPTQHGPLAEAVGNDSIAVKEMEIDERSNNVDLTTDLSQTIKSADSSNPNSPSDDASTGEVEQLDHNALFDPSFDITNFIDFGSLSCWSGNIQDLKTETGNVSLQEDKIEVATVDCKRTLESVDAAVNAESQDNQSLNDEGIQNEHNETCVSFGEDSPAAITVCPREVSDAIMGSEENQEDKKRVYRLDTMSEEDGRKDDAEMEENPNNSDYATYSDIKTNGVKRKADVLSEDLSEEDGKTVSLANVSFKIGECKARAASPMSGSNSVLKGSNFGDETHSVETFVSQLHCAGGTEKFEYEEMGDTYWTDWVIHNGGEEQTPPTEKGSYQVMPVELKPSQAQRARRPYKRRHSQIGIPLPASDKPANFNENAPAELIVKFSESDSIPPETSLSKMFRYFGPIRESQTEVDKENNWARIVYRKGSDAEVAYNSAGRFSIFGTKAVNYELSYTITETFKVQPDVVYLGEENATPYLPS